MEDLKKYLAIDKHALDNELAQQAELYHRVAEEHVQAVAERDALKEELAATDADLDGAMRIKIEKEGLKVTEGMVKSRIQTDPRHEIAFKTYIDAKVRSDKLQALKEAFHSRANMIESLCKLYATNYFEQRAIKGDANTDRVSYQQTRQRLAAQRAKGTE